MPLDISKAPAKFTNWKNSAKAPQETREGHGAPVIHSEKELDLTLDLSSDAYRRMVDWLVPGATLMAKEMAGMHVDHMQTISIRKRRMPEVAITMHDAQGRNVMLKLDRARLVGTTHIKISAQGARFELPVRIRGVVPRDRLTALDEYLFHDVLATIVQNQIDVEDEADRAKAGKKKKKGGQMIVIPRENGLDEQLPLT